MVAAFISGPRPAVRSPAASLAPVPQIVLKIDPSDDSIPINHLMREKSWTVAQAGPLVLKADFKRGLAAALSLKF